jgi:hypothetical protein
MLYLIGLSHNAQVRKRGAPETEAQKVFAECLRTCVREAQPDFIAEELTAERLARGSEDSVAREIALEFGVTHKFCDPTEEERRSIGYYDAIWITLALIGSDRLTFEEAGIKATAIEMAQYFSFRERFWLDRMKDCIGRVGIFICGEGHIESFTRLLDSHQVAWELRARKVGFVPGEDAHLQEVMRYLREHPELENWKR